MHSTCYGTKLLERDWPLLFWSSLNWDHPSGVGILPSPHSTVLDFPLGSNKGALMHLQCGESSNCSLLVILIDRISWWTLFEESLWDGERFRGCGSLWPSACIGAVCSSMRRDLNEDHHLHVQSQVSMRRLTSGLVRHQLSRDSGIGPLWWRESWVRGRTSWVTT